MDTDFDLACASRDTLLALIAEQQAIIAQRDATIAELQKRVDGLEARLAEKNSPGMPGNKPASVKRRPHKDSRKPRPKGFARSRSTPTKRVEHAVDVCPDCGTHLKGGWVQRRREVIELPVAPVEVIEHVFVARTCPLCRKRRVPKVQLEGSVVGRCRLGINLTSLIVYLREEARLPIRAIQEYLRTVHRVELSEGGIIQVVHQVAKKAQPAVGEIRERIRASPVVHADETGWREDGVNGYVVFATPTERYFVRGKRDKTVIDKVLGNSCQAVLVSDFYAAYNHYAGLKQRCWAHLLRELCTLTEMYPEDAWLQEWVQAVHALYEQAKTLPGSGEDERCNAQLEMEEKLLKMCRPFMEEPTAVQAKLCRRIERFIKELFVFVANPAVPSDNNQAERSLRHLVTSRKISGGTRSRQGSDSKMTLASLFGTWRARGLNPFLECRQLLSSLQD